MSTWRPPAPKAPGATASLVLGIVGCAGIVVVLPVVVGPLAWYLGARARREHEREPTRWSGGGEATAGIVLGMIATALMVVVLLFLLLAVVGLGFLQTYDSGYGT